MIKQLTDILRNQDEYKIQRRSMGLRLSGLLPVMTLKVNARPTRRIKAKVAEKYPPGRSRLYNEAGYVSEYALHRYLLAMNIKHKRWKLGSEVAPDFTITREGKLYKIGVRSRRHRDLMKFENEPTVDYPVRRLRNAKEIGDYVIAASNFTVSDGSSLVALWGGDRTG